MSAASTFRRGRLEPALVPWSISLSDTWLTVTCGEEQEPIVHLLAEFLPDQHTERVRIEFSGGGWVLLSPHDGREALPPDEYDWSGVPGQLQPGERRTQWATRVRQLWEQTGHHPRPDMYIVHDSEWAKSLRAERFGLTHFVFAGHDVRLDILARDFRWISEGPRSYGEAGEGD